MYFMLIILHNFIGFVQIYCDEKRGQHASININLSNFVPKTTILYSSVSFSSHGLQFEDEYYTFLFTLVVFFYMNKWGG